MSTKIATILHNAVNAKLKCEDPAVHRFVASLLSYEVENTAKVNGRLQNMAKRSSFYEFANATFPAGFVRLVRIKLERQGLRVIVRSAQAPEPLGPEMPTVDSFGFDPRYDYQIEVMKRLANLKSMVAQVATGGGKSRIFKLCERRIGLPTIFVTTRKSLMYQMAENYVETIGGPVGILGDNKWEPNPTGVNFAIVQTLSSRLADTTLEQEIDKLVRAHQGRVTQAIEEALAREKLPSRPELLKLLGPKAEIRAQQLRSNVLRQFNIDDRAILTEARLRTKDQLSRRQETLDFLEKMGFLVLEEAHEVGSDGFFTIAQACKNAHYRLALTATPFMRDDQESNMRLMAATGPVGVKVTEKELIERGILARPYFKYAEPPAVKGVTRSTAWAQAYQKGVVEHPGRNARIVFEVERAKKAGLTSMVLIQREAHGELLLEFLRREGILTEFISGKDNQTGRAQALKALGNGQIDCLIGSTILDVGVDVPSVGLIVLAGGGKAEVATRQRIGRGLRAKKNGPNICFVLDFMDGQNKHLIKHSQERRRIVEETPGFAEGIVPDFDYSAFS